MIKETEHLYIVKNTEILGGEPIIRETRTPVRAIVEMWRMGITLEEIPHRLPHLALAQVFNALSYYCDHQAEINDYIERNRISEPLIDLPESSHESTVVH
jgi:uncharacterized protein (DUF433 family)